MEILLVVLKETDGIKTLIESGLSEKIYFKRLVLRTVLFLK
jgi:hypothetical protein